MRPIRKVLIANRGEIACRIIRAAKARGVKTIAIYSQADEYALHVRLADEAVLVGGPAAADSYLKIDAVISAARRTGAEAIHPGYGFLAENPRFAEACAREGIVFIGPPAAAIAAMGDKAEAKRRMIAAGVPCVPGYQDEEQSDARLATEAKRIGFPVMLKASAGGGGRGMRLVSELAALAEAVASARREAESGFGDGRLIVERAIVGARHVEVQVLADTHGNVIHLGERDCSLQRRRQKVIEEAPSPVIDSAMREKMGAAAVEAARAVGYVSAGTVEFLYDPARREFYFLEMNTRIQVEHPVTEEVTGVDLVEQQFVIAEGGVLRLPQEHIRLDGWAMEARLYAEDPSKDFLPQTGRITALNFPAGVRVDAGVMAGDAVSSFYDPMIAKIIAYGETRDEARLRLAAALENTTVLGLTTNTPFLIALLHDETFAKGGADTGYIERHLDVLATPAVASALDIALAAAALLDTPLDRPLAGWGSRGPMRIPLKLRQGEEVLTAWVTIGAGGRIEAALGEDRADVRITEMKDGAICFVAEGVISAAAFARDGAIVDIQRGTQALRFVDLTFAPAGEAGVGADSVLAPMAGLVAAVLVRAGEKVTKGQIVAVIEAMKMEHRLVAPRDGVVREVCIAIGDQAGIRAPLVYLEQA